MTLLNWSRLISPPSTEHQPSKLLSITEFDHAAACERMRVDRNQSKLSVLLVSGSANGSSTSLESLAAAIAGRLRMTDTVGRIRSALLGVLLPDTPLQGAWRVRDIIVDLGAEVGWTLECEILVYPDDTPPQAITTPDSYGDGRSADREPMPVHLNGGAEALFAQPIPWWKRACDIAGASLGLMVATPIIGAAALAVVATSRGGAFYVQEREGHGGRRFKIYKIRTMKAGADRLKDSLRSTSEQDGPAFKLTRDPRVTRIGSFLRKTSIDELPQLLNVLRGDMSLVGPRPLQVDESLKCEPWQRQRLTVRPGLTCIWQVKGRNVVPFDEWIRMDLAYARRRTWCQDLSLIVQTIPSLLFSRGPR